MPEQVDQLVAEITKLRDELSGQVVLRVGAQAERDLLRKLVDERRGILTKASRQIDLSPLDNVVWDAVETPSPDEEAYYELLADHDEISATLAAYEPIIELCRQLAAAHGRGTQALINRRKRLGREITQLVRAMDERDQS
jgi:hypothetical protein